MTGLREWSLCTLECPGTRHRGDQYTQVQTYPEADDRGQGFSHTAVTGQGSHTQPWQKATNEQSTYRGVSEMGDCEYKISHSSVVVF